MTTPLPRPAPDRCYGCGWRDPDGPPPSLAPGEVWLCPECTQEAEMMETGAIP